MKKYIEKSPQQTRRMSAVETTTSVVIGFAVSLALSCVVYPAFGCNFSFAENVALVWVFTIASLVRGYAVRRFFVWLASSRGVL